MSFDRRRVHCVAWLLSHPPFPIRQADVDVVVFISLRLMVLITFIKIFLLIFFCFP